MIRMKNCRHRYVFVHTNNYDINGVDFPIMCNKCLRIVDLHEERKRHGFILENEEPEAEKYK